jgi:hypothetical protein
MRVLGTAIEIIGIQTPTTASRSGSFRCGLARTRPASKTHSLRGRRSTLGWPRSTMGSAATQQPPRVRANRISVPIYEIHCLRPCQMTGLAGRLPLSNGRKRRAMRPSRSRTITSLLAAIAAGSAISAMIGAPTAIAAPPPPCAADQTMDPNGNCVNIPTQVPNNTPTNQGGNQGGMGSGGRGGYGY